MRWWPSASSLFSSSSQKSQKSQPDCGKRSARLRKWRHILDSEVSSAVTLTTVPSSPNRPSTQLSRSTSSGNLLSATPSLVPQPLPLPESVSVFSIRRRGGSADSNLKWSSCYSEDFRLPSPNEVLNRCSIEENDREKDRYLAGECMRDGHLSSAASGRASFRGTEKSTGPVERCSHKQVAQDVSCVGSTYDSFCLNVPSKSAPSTPLAIPAPSPRQSNAGNCKCQAQGLQMWSAPEISTRNLSAGFPFQPSPEHINYSHDNSPLFTHFPLYSPTGRSPERNPKSTVGPSLNQNSSSCRQETTSPISVHRLPLPPGVSISSQTSQVISKLESQPQIGQWQKGKLIGRGACGSVYTATNRETGALCAMKEIELLPDDPKSVECFKQLEQEIKVLSQLKHPNIVQYYGSEFIEDRFYIYLEYVYPGSINKYIREHGGSITESVVRSFTRHILSGLAYLHSTKTIHRDIKGANLLVDSSGIVKLADFGMAKHLTGQAANISMKGSPYWMAPELLLAVMQRHSNPDLALAVDIWSVGCTIIEMLNGKPPWSEFEGAAAMFKVMRETPSLPESLSPEGKGFLRLCFQRNPADRPTAPMLLEHRFLKSLVHLDVPPHVHGSRGANLMDRRHFRGEWPTTSSDHASSPTPAPTPSSPPQATKAKAVSDSELGRPSQAQVSNLIVACHPSPHSTLDVALNSLSPPHAGTKTYVPSPSAHLYRSNCGSTEN